MSFRDVFGRRVSVPDPEMIRESGRLARKMADQLKEARLGGMTPDEVIVDEAVDFKTVERRHGFATFEISKGSSTGVVMPDINYEELELRAMAQMMRPDAADAAKAGVLAEAYGMSARRVAERWPDAGPAETEFRTELMGKFPSTSEQRSRDISELNEAMRRDVLASMAVPPEILRDLAESLGKLEPNPEPPDDGLEYEIVARTATVRTAASKKNIAKAQMKPHIYNWGFQSSIPRYMGQYITYEAQLYEDGTTSCNCPGWVMKRSGQERGCKHTKLIADEAKELHKKFKKGEDLPTVAITEEQINRLKNSKAGAAAAAAGETTAIKFGRIVETD